LGAQLCSWSRHNNIQVGFLVGILKLLGEGTSQARRLTLHEFQSLDAASVAHFRVHHFRLQNDISHITMYMILLFTHWLLSCWLESSVHTDDAIQYLLFG
jgi:hypothetical protein